VNNPKNNWSCTALLGAQAEAPSDESVRRETELEVAQIDAERSARRERLAVSGGHLLSAAFRFLGELLPPPSGSTESNSSTTVVAATLKQSLSDLVEQDDHGRPRLIFALPDAAALDELSNILARVLARTPPFQVLTTALRPSSAMRT
jgi:hypothetical protein